ncbi:FGGY-family carbohydrate kinase [Nakamurella endophytica]|uniref:Carbohydrate kinase n=1 Tax=Nakamurella endophytica TaxID=1748367 RepID=A0A917SQ72_9ACTN|nr:FGGY-family carbohydrate kinase [Nakamurella endophytica]GGL93333.1 hypothetical protein GCM10011594_11490 [Nakamurella endophytica]
MRDCVVSVDIGSGGVRARAHDRALRTVAEAGLEVATRVGADGASTQDLTEVVAAVDAAVRRVAAAPGVRVRALAASGTASSLVLPARSGTGPAPEERAGTDGTDGTDAGDGGAGGSDGGGTVVLWSDTRAHRAGLQLTPELVDAYRRTVCPPDASYWPAKIRWARDAGLPRAAALLGVKDEVFRRWTGRCWTDPMTAAATGLFDSERWEWDAALTDRLQVDAEMLPAVRAATDQAPLGAGAADRLGLPGGLPVVLGGMDGPLTQIGAAGFESGIASCTIGTSIAYRAGLGHRAVDPSRRVWCYPVTPDRWVAGGAGSNGGNVLTWLQGTWAAGSSLAGTLAAGFSVPADPELVFVPYLHGERAPVWRSDLRAALVGLAAHHGPADVARATLTGVAAAAVELADAVTAVAGPAGEVRLSGGFVQEPRWVQLLTDAVGRRTALPDPATATSTGLALLAWAAVEDIPPDQVFQPTTGESWEPDPRAHAALRATAARVAGFRELLWPS